MTDTALIEASLFQLKTAAAAIDDPMFNAQLRLTLDVLSNAVAAASESLTSAAVNDIAFALNDVAGTVGELNAADAAAITPPLEMMQADVETLRQATALPAEVVHAVRMFGAKLRARRTAIERQTYRAEGSAGEPLPHAPEELCREALPLRESLARFGFATPALDALIDDPQSLRFHSIGDIVDELDVIVGA